MMENPKSEEDGIEIMMNEKADEIIEELFYSTKNKYQNNLELKIASESVFYYVQLFYYKRHQSWWIMYWFSWLDIKQKINYKSYP